MLQRSGSNLVWFGVLSSSLICLGVLAAHVGRGRATATFATVILAQDPGVENQSTSNGNGETDQEKEKVIARRSVAQTRTSWTDPARIAGHEKCIDCHQTEIKSWLSSKHSSRAFDLLRTSQRALEYAKNLHIRPADIAKSEICVNCHGTPQLQLDQRVGVIAGVSCESCHNAAGGDSGWLNAHAVYGFADTRREQESDEHYAHRAERCVNAGQLRSSNLYGLTKRCFDCHVVGDEVLAEAGHSHGYGFEMVEKSLGEIRHNFVLNPSSNAKTATLWTDPFRYGKHRSVEGRLRVMFVLGQMIDLEISLRNLARATAENEFSDAMLGRIDDAFELLSEDILAEVEDTEFDNGQRPDIEEIEAIVELVEPVWESLDDEGFNSDNTNKYIAIADAIAVQAKAFSQRDGQQLAFLDELDLLPEDFFDGAYEPNPQTNGPTGQN